MGSRLHALTVSHVEEWEEDFKGDGGRIVAAADGLYKKGAEAMELVDRLRLPLPKGR